MVQTIQRPLARAAEATEILPIVLKLSPLIEMDDERFAEFCRLNLPAFTFDLKEIWEWEL